MVRPGEKMRIKFSNIGNPVRVQYPILIVQVTFLKDALSFKKVI